MRYEFVFLFRHLADRIGVAIVIHYDEFDAVIAQCIVEIRRGFYPAAVCRMTCIPKRTIDEFYVVLIFGHDGNFNALSLAQVAILGIGTGKGVPGLPVEQKSLYKVIKLVPDAVVKP